MPSNSYWHGHFKFCIGITRTEVLICTIHIMTHVLATKKSKQLEKFKKIIWIGVVVNNTLGHLEFPCHRLSEDNQLILRKVFLKIF